MKAELLKKVQTTIVKSEKRQKDLENKMRTDNSLVPAYLKEYGKLEAVEFAGESLKDLDKKYSSKWLGLGSVLVNALAEAYLSYVSRKVPLK